jgi:hypothetical protein
MEMCEMRQRWRKEGMRRKEQGRKERWKKNSNNRVPKVPLY